MLVPLYLFHLSLSLATQHPRSPDPSSPMVLYKLKAIRPGKASPSMVTTGTPVAYNAEGCCYTVVGKLT